jgi:DNA-binding NarL/FixJ family response regulator
MVMLEVLKFLGKQSLKSIDDLNASETLKNWNQVKSRSKENVSILVVDDEDFSPLEPLKKNGFNIISLKDIDNISQIEPFSVVLYDLQGIGLSLNMEMQGAHLIRETKKRYPEKYVIAYTGGASDQRVHRAITEADLYVPKDKSISDWVDLLSNAVDEVTNPVIVWKKFRYKLLEKGLLPFQITILEDAFVRYYECGPYKLKEELLKSLGFVKNDQVSNQIITSLISTGIKHIIFPS